MIHRFMQSDAVASLLAVPPQSSFHVVECDDNQWVADIHSVATLKLRENGGYFVLRPEVFDVLNEGEDLVGDALLRLSKQKKVLAYEYDGFWQPADTLKERADLEAMYREGRRPWAVWDGSGATRSSASRHQPGSDGASRATTAATRTG
jgi:glucose-1-phosphate cytidylyltransferase